MSYAIPTEPEIVIRTFAHPNTSTNAETFSVLKRKSEGSRRIEIDVKLCETLETEIQTQRALMAEVVAAWSNHWQTGMTMTPDKLPNAMQAIRDYLDSAKPNQTTK